MGHGLVASGRSLVVTAFLSLLLAGCPRSRPLAVPPVPDAGPYDGGIDPTLDTDGDGVCDVTEIRHHLDPMNPDTDNDGFSDYEELVLGYDPTQPGSPERSTVFIMSEAPAGSVQVPVTISVRGVGADYTGTFADLPAADVVGETAADFFSGAVAEFADPTENVAVLDATNATFRGVVGTTRLSWQVRFAFGDNLVRRCIRAYPFQFFVKRNDGVLVYQKKYLLVIVPAGEMFGAPDWCAPPTGGCI